MARRKRLNGNSRKNPDRRSSYSELKKKKPCQVCRSIVLSIQARGRSSVSLGSLATVMAESECKAHKQLLSRCLVMGPQVNADTKLSMEGRLWPPIVVISKGSVDPDHRITSRGLSLLRRTVRSDQVGDARLVNPKWIDLNLLRRWKRSCEQSHGQRCSHSIVTIPVSFAGPAWLVDTWKQCLVPGCSTYPYIALSYVWGSLGNILSTQRRNLKRLQQPNAFRREKFRQRIPNTVKDAIGLAELLGERYLWVDSLCIVQDDELNKHQQLANMAMIFQQASVTIIARQGHDANFGLRGLRGISQPRDFTQEIFKLGQGNQIVGRRLGRPERKPSVWETRAWTYQEDHFSSRKLIFDDDHVYWQCGGMLCQEDSFSQERGFPSLESNISSIITGPYPNMEGLRRLLNEYHCRTLSYAEDILKAFWGISVATSIDFKGGFIGGLPAVFFDIALLWQPQSRMYRRKGKAIESQQRWLPSWSWAGWAGKLDSWTWTQATDFIADASETWVETTERVIPVVQWYAQMDPSSEAKPILQEWYDYRLNYLDSERPPPPGWERCEDSDDGSTVSHPDYPPYPPEGDHDPKYYWKRNDSYSLVRSRDRFWYPFPIHDLATGLPPWTLPFLISCRTRRGALHSAERISTTRPTVSLRDQNGTWVGSLQMTEEPPCDLTNNRSINHSGDQTLELVEISRGYIYEFQRECGFDEWQLEERPKSAEKYEFYNVLWVQWKDGFAYRKGLGRVFKDAWEQQSLTWIDLKLC